MTSKKSNKIQYLYLFVFIVLIVTALLLNLFLSIDADDINRDNFGMFGDYFGGLLTPILTFITICYLISSNVKQSEVIEITSKQLDTTTQELKLSRDELSLTRAELKTAAEAQKEQAKTLAEQSDLLQTSNKQVLVSTEISQCNEVISKIQNLWIAYTQGTIALYIHKQDDKKFTLAMKYEDIDEINAAQYRANFGQWSSLPSLLSLSDRTLDDLKLTDCAKSKYCKLTSLMVQYHFAFNSILTQNGMMYCYHYIDDLVEQMNMLIAIVPKSMNIAQIKFRTGEALTILDNLLEFNDYYEHSELNSKLIMARIIRDKLHKINYLDFDIFDALVDY